MVTPCSVGQGEERFGGFLRDEGRGRRSSVKDRWSARLSRSSASVRSIARVLTTRRRSTSSSMSRFGSFRATSSRVCVVASGVRSSWEALAANLRCSATCASSRASMASKLSASSRSSSLRPGSRIRCESDPVAATRVASVIRVKGASIRPASSHPPTRPKTSRIASTSAAAEPKPFRGSERSAKIHHEGWRRAITPSGDVAQHDHPHGGEHHDAGDHQEADVAERELDANTQTRGSLHGLLLHAGAPGCVSMR